MSQFRTLTSLLDDGDSEYVEIMNSIHVKKEKRYELVKEARYSTVPETGEQQVTIEFIDHGAESEIEDVY